MELTLIRHADVARGDDVNAFDPPLSDRGQRQAECLAERARRWQRPTAVLVSPALRARETAEPLCAAVGVTPTVAPWLEEIRRPDGTTVDIVRADVWSEGAAWTAFRDRVTGGLASMLAEAGASPHGDPPRSWAIDRIGPRIVLIGHGMAQAVALEYLLGVSTVPWAGHRFQFAHASFARVRAFSLGAEWIFGLLKYNETEHVPRELRSH